MDLVIGSSPSGSLVFDLYSESGVLAVLSAIRSSSLPSDRKSELRDLVFVYRTSGGTDPALRTQIENELASLAVAPVTPVTSTSNSLTPALKVEAAVPLPRAGFATGRPVPRFASPVVKSGDIVRRTHQPVSVPAPVARTVPVRTTRIEPMPPLASVPPVMTPRAAAPAIPIVSVSVPEVTIVASPKPVAAPKISTPTPAPVAEVVVDSSRNEAARARINDIKQQVNTKAGTAVNLLVRDKAVGGEYMSALLEAMKVVSADADTTLPMRRLELAYKAVEDMLRDEPVAPVAAPTLAPIPTPPVVAPVVVEPVPVVAAPVAVAVVEQSAPRIVPNIPQATNYVQPPVAPIVSPIPVAPYVPEVAAPAPFYNTPTMSVPAVAAASPLLVPTDLPTASQKKAQMGNTDPLFDAEVDAGLEQLLSEWSLFKKSGMFGAGPKGRNHPLFQKMATLQLPLILSGRFEGSTPEIKQSVTDYMNGWRYEQGIIYEADEQFEHYLRRVIRHIIDLQMSGGR